MQQFFKVIGKPSIALTIATALALLSCKPVRAQAATPTLKPRNSADSALVFDFICHISSGAPCPTMLAEDLRVHLDGKSLPEASLSISPAMPQMLILLDAINTPLADLRRVSKHSRIR